MGNGKFSGANKQKNFNSGFRIVLEYIIFRVYAGAIYKNHGT